MKKTAIIAVAALMCVAFVPAVTAAEGVGSTSSPQVGGEWEFKSQMPGRNSTATMTITKSADGKLSGTWSAQWGESTLSDITFENGKVKFVQTSNFGGQEMKTDYEGAIEGGKIKGTGKGQFGEFTFDGTLQGEPKTGAEAICGQWQINVTMPAREMVEKMTITKNADGMLAGKWESRRGQNTISDVKFECGKLTFTRTSKMGEMEFSSTFEGTVEGDTIKGVFKSERGDREVTATRAIAARPEPAKSEPNKPAPEKKPSPDDKPT